jgi:putative oxidoreductase
MPMSAQEYLENSRNLAERILRLAVANVLWRSGQTKADGFSTREETFNLFREEYKVPFFALPMPPPT